MLYVYSVRYYVVCSAYLVVVICFVGIFFFFKQKTAYGVRISDWSSDVCSSDLTGCTAGAEPLAILLRLRHQRPEVLDAGGRARVRGSELRRRLATAGLAHALPQRDRLLRVVAGRRGQHQANLVGLRFLLARIRQIGSASCREKVCQSVYI